MTEDKIRLEAAEILGLKKPFIVDKSLCYYDISKNSNSEDSVKVLSDADLAWMLQQKIANLPRSKRQIAINKCESEAEELVSNGWDRNYWLKWKATRLQIIKLYLLALGVKVDKD